MNPKYALLVQHRPPPPHLIVITVFNDIKHGNLALTHNNLKELKEPKRPQALNVMSFTLLILHKYWGKLNCIPISISFTIDNLQNHTKADLQEEIFQPKTLVHRSKFSLPALREGRQVSQPPLYSFSKRREGDAP